MVKKPRPRRVDPGEMLALPRIAEEIGLDEETPRRLIERRCGSPRELVLEGERLRHGLEAAAVVRMTARFRRPTGSRGVWRWVVKWLPPGTPRELAVLRRLERGRAPFSPDVLAVEPAAAGGSLVHMEWVRPVRLWPWSDLAVTRKVMRRFARIHDDLDDRLDAADLPPWDYEDELQRSAWATVWHLEHLPPEARPRVIRRAIPASYRIAEALPAIRRQLRAWGRADEGWIHGDLHSGNVLLRARGGRRAPVLLDWGRTRRGSRLEDLSSWMLSLGHWEPRVARRHDRLLRDYLEAAGARPRLDPGFRDAYWLAGACNAMAGALRFRVAAAAQARTERERRHALAAAAPWARALRRADVRWREARRRA